VRFLAEYLKTTSKVPFCLLFLLLNCPPLKSLTLPYENSFGKFGNVLIFLLGRHICRPLLFGLFLQLDRDDAQGLVTDIFQRVWW